MSDKVFIRLLYRGSIILTELNFGRSQRCQHVMCLPVTKYKSPLRITRFHHTRFPNNNALASTLSPDALLAL